MSVHPPAQGKRGNYVSMDLKLESLQEVLQNKFIIFFSACALAGQFAAFTPV
jgi:hypothetical protein